MWVAGLCGCIGLLSQPYCAFRSAVGEGTVGHTGRRALAASMAYEAWSTMFRRLRRAIRLSRRIAGARRDVRALLGTSSGRSPRPDMRPVYFYGNFKLSSFKLGGTYIIEGLKLRGIRACSGHRVPVERVRDAIVVFVREKIPRDLAAIRANNNAIVIDMRDNFIEEWGALRSDFVGRDAADCLIFPNEALKKAFLAAGPTSARCKVLYGFADPRIATFFAGAGYASLDGPRCCYFGFSQNLDKAMVDSQQARERVNVIPLTEKNFDTCVPMLRDFNLHLDVRPSDNQYKPLTKVLIAAECRSHIIMRESPRVLELLPAHYPFLFRGDGLGEAIRLAYEAFRTPRWDKALRAMDSVRERHSYSHHLDRFVQILEELS